MLDLWNLPSVSYRGIGPCSKYLCFSGKLSFVTWKNVGKMRKKSHELKAMNTSLSGKLLSKTRVRRENFWPKKLSTGGEVIEKRGTVVIFGPMVLSKIVHVAWLPCTCDRGIPMRLPRISLNRSSRIRKIGFHSTTILLALEIKFYFWCTCLYHKINFLSSSILLHVCSALLLQTQRNIAFLRVYSRTPLTRTPKESGKLFKFSGGSS
jgi:hypothetical protein